jgi:hypothetical protein
MNSQGISSVDRRNAIQRAVGTLLTTSVFSPWLQAMAKTIRSDKVVWGGLGYSVPAAQVPKLFPNFEAATKELGGFSKLVNAFTGELSKRYPAGFETDPTKMLDVRDDPGLMFTVAIDYEQVIQVPTLDGAGIQMSYLYGTAQVFYLELPRSGGSSGDLKVLFSFPFRVQSQEAVKPGDKVGQIKAVKRLLTEVNPSLVSHFGNKVAQRSFAQYFPPKRIKVSSVRFTPEAMNVVKELGIEDRFSDLFFGQALTSSLAEHAGISILPYGQSDVLNKGLAERFNRFPNISKIFETLDAPDANNYSVELVVHRVLRKPNGSNIANLLYARGLACIIKVIDNFDPAKKVIFEKTVLFIENSELPKAMMDNLKDFDLKSLVQMAIYTFDTFAQAVATGSADKMKAIGLKADADSAALKELNAIFDQCRYSS